MVDDTRPISVRMTELHIIMKSDPPFQRSDRAVEWHRLDEILQERFKPHLGQYSLGLLSAHELYERIALAASRPE